MIKKELSSLGISTKEKEIYEVELVEFETECFSCIDTEGILYLGVNKKEAQKVWATAKDHLKATLQPSIQLNDVFLGLRFNCYQLADNGDYELVASEEDYGIFGD